MANRLKMAKVHAIQVLRSRGWSQRRIARELGVHRDTVARHVRQDAKAAGPDPPKQAISIPGSAEPDRAAPTGRRSRCEPYRDVIIEMLERGLSTQRIWQDLTAEHGFGDSYQSVQRFVRKLRTTSPLPFRRMECEPGEEAQVDFGTAAPVITTDGDPATSGVKGKRRRPHLFRIVLNHSRKAYSEAVFRQTTDDFLRCLENAFHHFGGVPKTLVIDNLKAAVTKADWFDPDLNPKIVVLQGVDHPHRAELKAHLRLPEGEKSLRCRRIRQHERCGRTGEEHDPAGRLDMHEALDRPDHSIDRLMR